MEVTKSKLTDAEIGSAISFINAMGKLSDEELRARDLQIGEPQQINHFLMAVINKQSTMLPEQAMTLLRLTPILLPKGSRTVHHVILTAGPRVKELFEQATELSDKKRYAEVLKTAGAVCMSRRLCSIDRELREKEFALFKPFIGDTLAYKNARERFDARGIGPKSPLKVGDAMNACKLPDFVNIARYSKAD